MKITDYQSVLYDIWAGDEKSISIMDVINELNKDNEGLLCEALRDYYNNASNLDGDIKQIDRAIQRALDKANDYNPDPFNDDGGHDASIAEDQFHAVRALQRGSE